MPLFSNPWIHDDHNLADVLRWKFGLSPKDDPSSAPDTPAPSVPYAAEVPPAEGWRVTWLGHSSFLLQGAGKSLLVDPVFSDHCAPLPLPAMRRLVPPPCRVDQLPSIDAVLLTHSHYDHLDLPTLRLLGKEMPLFVAEGHEAWLRKQGFRHVTQLPWWSAAEILPGITATATPAQHFTARTPFDRNHGHWCGWLVEGAGVKLWHAGDSGYCPAFKEIGDRFGPIDFGMIPIGAYSPRWFMGSMHMNPEDAVMAFQETRCRQAVAMHWGTFRLTDEPMGEPPLRLLAAMEEAGLDSESFTTLAVGESKAVQRF
jgi:N-acyl-phosphatidylethanolamine-hydrolysing phospholipase D